MQQLAKLNKHQQIMLFKTKKKNTILRNSFEYRCPISDNGIKRSFYMSWELEYSIHSVKVSS